MSHKLTLFDAVHTLRYHLDELLDKEDAEAFALELTGILENAESDIKALIKRHDATIQWTHEFLYESDDVRKSYNELPGEPSHATGGLKKYVCPEFKCPEYWYQRKAGQKIPCCCFHEIPLISEDTSS